MLRPRVALFAVGNSRYTTPMKRHLTTSLAWLLSALIFVTSAQMAVARGNAMMAGQIVICNGYGLKVINVDADNQPIGPVHYCPDCALSFMDLVTPGLPDVCDPSRVSAARFAAIHAHPHQPDCHLAVPARGPPVYSL